ncbi:PREDICTED: basic 7S globulin [Theobroma cacao]|uniref:Eukaryotic aspartyl protease family protein, putative n=2 Tax=Theobroma cacao TaxID=3641 RepID=A0A061F3Y1_THECC|nr:PREDICTED: basic 7S globulin [Theobroma cacao]EOY11402.1 Eukaryotic aspartyl protease family protein, putative [Theobroma cacao]
MASSSLYVILIFLSFSPFILISESQKPSKSNRFVLPVHQDKKTNLYVADIYKRTPPLQVPFVVDLNGRVLWVTCNQNYLSSTYRAPRCHSTQCARARTQYCHTCSSKARPGCHNNTCALKSVNPVTRLTAISELAQDVLSIQSTQGSNTGPLIRIPQFLFACESSSLLQRGLPGNVQGVAGLGNSPISLPIQLASHFGFAGFAPTFALCLAPKGVVFFGDSPYHMLPDVDISRPLRYTPLIISPQGEYYIEVRSIKINNKDVPINKTVLSINKRGFGGTKLSTINPYTVLEHSIFKAVTHFFTNELSGIPQVKPVKPFGVCFGSKSFKSTRFGPGVPNIDLVLHNQHVTWRIFGANSMVQAAPGVSCLAFVDGGVNTRASIVIGAYQMENNLVQFDLARSRLGFSSSLLHFKTSCNNFNFTAIP